MAALGLADDFRKSALECLNLSREADSLGSQVHWVSMAQFWFQLAQHVEDREAVEAANAAAVDGEEAAQDIGKPN